MKNIIELQHVNKTYKTGAMALKDVSLTVKEGEFVYVVGSSGSGKSTLTKILYRHENVDSGNVEINGIDVDALRYNELYKLRREVGVVFQNYELIRSKTVYENVAYAMQVVGTPRAEIRERVLEVLDFVGLSAKINQFPDKLSGGEQQRVAIARAIVNRPALVLADEPTGNLDPETSWLIMELLERINLNGTTVLMVTHNSTIVDTLKHRVITIDDGRIISDVTDTEVQ